MARPKDHDFQKSLALQVQVRFKANLFKIYSFLYVDDPIRFEGILGLGGEIEGQIQKITAEV